MKLRSQRTLVRAINNITEYLETNPRDVMQQARLAKLKAIIASGAFAKKED